MVLPYFDLNLPWVYMCPHPEHHHPHFSPYPIPLGHPSAPALSALYHASNLDWWFVSHMIIYMFQCHSPISSRPRPLPQSPKDCSVEKAPFLTAAACCVRHPVPSRLPGGPGFTLPPLFISVVQPRNNLSAQRMLLEHVHCGRGCSTSSVPLGSPGRARGGGEGQQAKAWAWLPFPGRQL